MFRAYSQLRLIQASSASGIGGLFSFLSDDSDLVRPKFRNREYEDSLKTESGWKRVKDMYTLDDDGFMTKEAHTIVQSGFAAGFLGIAVGGYYKSKEAFQNFMENNQATAFQSNFQAKKKLQSQVSIAFGKGGFQLAWRLALFSSCFTCICTTISVYRGKSSVWEYSAAGLLTGFLYKTPLGLRASLVGATVGGVLGSLAGSVTYLILRVTGTTMEEVRYWQYQFQERRNRAEILMQSKKLDETTDPLMIHHTQISSSTPGIHEISPESQSN